MRCSATAWTGMPSTSRRKGCHACLRLCRHPSPAGHSSQAGRWPPQPLHVASRLPSGPGPDGCGRPGAPGWWLQSVRCKAHRCPIGHVAGTRPITMHSAGRMACDLRMRGSERVTRIELALSAWEADVLPLNYTRGAHRPGQRWRSRAITTCPDMVPDAAHRRGSANRAAGVAVSECRAARSAPAPFRAAQPAERVSCERAAV